MTTNAAATPPIQQQKPAPAVDARLSLAAGLKAVLDVATSPSQAHTPDGVTLLTAYEGHASGDVLLEKFALTTSDELRDVDVSRRAATSSFRRWTPHPASWRCADKLKRPPGPSSCLF